MIDIINILLFYTFFSLGVYQYSKGDFKYIFVFLLYILSFFIVNEIHQRIILSIISIIIGLDIKNWYSCLNLKKYIIEYNLSNLENCNHIEIFKQGLENYSNKINGVLDEYRKNRLELPNELKILYNNTQSKLIDVIKLQNIINNFSILIVRNYSPHLGDAYRLKNININGNNYNENDYNKEIGWIKNQLNSVFVLSINQSPRINDDELKKILIEMENIMVYQSDKMENIAEMEIKLNNHFNKYITFL